MKYVSLGKYPNQSFSVQENNTVIVFALRYFRGITYVSLTDSAGGIVRNSIRATNKHWLFPAEYEATVGANYRFEDDNGEYPVYSNFNGTCVLCRYSHAEAAAKRTEEGAWL